MMLFQGRSKIERSPKHKVTKKHISHQGNTVLNCFQFGYLGLFCSFADVEGLDGDCDQIYVVFTDSPFAVIFAECDSTNYLQKT